MHHKLLPDISEEREREAVMSVEDDEALARRLQAEEDADAARVLTARQRQVDELESRFKQKLASGASFVARYERRGAEDAARAVLPMAELELQAEEKLGDAAPGDEKTKGGQKDYLVREMLSLFKHRFFTWVNQPACPRASCMKNDNTTKRHPIGGGRPVSELELEGEAGLVELYRCSGCGDTVRFARMNNPVTLLTKSRKGRCGEWANAFCLCLLANGFDARYVLDWTDHVWCEYWSDALGRYIHVDACEASWDEPLLYEQGWGKKLSYVIAFGRDGVVDVSKRYTKDFSELAGRRTHIRESELSAAIATMTARRRQARGLDESRRRQLEARDALERCELERGASSESDGGEGGKDADAAAPLLSLPGRISGSAEWKAARGECGTQTVPVTKASTSKDMDGKSGKETSLASSTVPVVATFETRLRAEFDSIRRTDPSMSPNDAAIAALKRLSVSSGQSTTK